MDRHFQSSLTSHLGPVNAEAVVVGEGGRVGDVSLGRYSTIIKPVAIPLSAPISHSPFAYSVAAGENLKTIAAKFHVTVSEIRWSNTNLISSDVVPTGDPVMTPPVPGIVVTTKGSDTLDSLAVKYQSDAQTILDFNRLRSPQLAAGTVLVIPGGGGDARFWYQNAPAAGYPGGPTPKGGAIMVTWESYLGHVAYVEAVNADGSWVVTEMNYVAFDVISTRTIKPGQLGGRLVGFIY